MGEKYYICYIPEWDMEEIEPIYVLKAEDIDEEEGEVYVNGKEVFYIDENSNYYADENGSRFCQPGDLIFEVLGDYIFYRPGINCIAGSANYANDFLIGTPEEIKNFKAEYGDEIMKDLGENTINMNRSQLREMIDLCVKNILKESYGDSDYAIMERAEEMINDAFDYGYIEEGESWEEIVRTNSYIDESAQSLSEEFDINIDDAFNYLGRAFNGYENMYEGKTKHKQVTISESKLKEMIKESVKKVISEIGNTEDGQRALANLYLRKEKNGDDVGAEDVLSYASKERKKHGAIKKSSERRRLNKAFNKELYRR